MPELPEVETTRQYLLKLLRGDKWQGLENISSRVGQILPNPESFQTLQGREILDIQRHGKWLIWQFDRSGYIVSHLRMSGRFQTDTHTHARFKLLFVSKSVYFVDQRKFGTIQYVDELSAHSGLSRLGRDALDEQLEGVELFSKALRIQKPIHSALLDQTLIAGIGNIYASEILHAAQMHPLRPANSISVAEWERLLLASRSILTAAIRQKGTSLGDRLYFDPDGSSDSYASFLQVYGKSDPEIIKKKINGRMTYWRKNQN